MGTETEIGSKELEIIMCRQWVQLFFQLLLGEARRKPPDDHLAQKRRFLLARFAFPAPRDGGRGRR